MKALTSRQTKNGRRPLKKELVYRVNPYNGGLVFARPERAALIARINAALTSTTWGEFRAAMPRKEYSQIVQLFDFNCDPRPKSTDEFSAESAPGWEEGDCPPWLQREMDRVVPQSLLQKFGERTDTFLNGSFWTIRQENVEAMCAALVALGWKVTHAPDLNFH